MVPERKLTAFYLLGLALTAIGMLILPLIYVALAVMMWWGVWHFATHAFLPIWAWPIGRSFYSNEDDLNIPTTEDFLIPVGNAISSSAGPMALVPAPDGEPDPIDFGKQTI